MLQPSIPAGSLELLRRLVPLLALFVAAAALIGVVTRSMGGSGNAHAIVEQALSGDAAPRSGRFEADLKLSLEGPSAPSSPVTMTMKGAFAEQGKGKLPKLDLDMTARGLGQSFNAGVISTGRSMFVGFGGEHYALPDRALSRLVAERNSTPEGAPVLRSLGLDTAAWLENETVTGTARVGGVETTHVAADVNVERMLQDLARVASTAPRPAGVQAPEIPGAVVEQVRDAVEVAKLDVFVGRQDKVVRRVELRVAFEAKTASAASPVTGELELGLDVSDVNKPIRVEAPGNARPFSELRSGLDTSVLGGGLGGGLGAPAASQAVPAPAGGEAGQAQAPVASSGEAGPVGVEGGQAQAPVGSSGEATASAQTSAYLSCVEKAETSSELQGCAPLLER